MLKPKVRYFTPPHDFKRYLLFLNFTLSFKLVGEAMSAIAANTNVPVTVKCRIGVDNHDSYDELCELFLLSVFLKSRMDLPLRSNTAFPLLLGDFIYKVSTLSPTRHFIVHSRKALLGGISPADNRRIPPLKFVYRNLPLAYLQLCMIYLFL